VLYDGERKNFAGFVKDEKPHKKKLFAGSAQNLEHKRRREREKYVRVSRESISISISFIISFITRKQNASLHKQQATHRED